MSYGGDQADPGWYPDHYDPSKVRYWDGEVWTDHYAPAPGGVSSSGGSGGLPSIGSWLGATFNAIGAYGIPAAALAVGTGLVINIVTWLGLYWTVGDAALINEEFVGDWVPMVVRGGVIILLLVLAQGFVWLAVNRFMQRAHLQANPTIGEALQRALTRMPRLIGVFLLVGLMFIVAMVAIALVIGGLAAATGDGAAAAIIVLLMVLALVPLAIWASVKLSFLSAAVVAAPMSESVIRTSAGVSKGRFWGVLGRVLLVGIGIFVVSSTASAALGGLGQPIDQSEIEDLFQVEGDEFVFDGNLVFSDLLPTGGALVASIIFSSIINGLTGLVSTSAYMRLYLDSGAPSEL